MTSNPQNCDKSLIKDLKMDQKMVKRRWQKPLDDRQMRKCSLRQEGFISRSPWEPRKINCIFESVDSR